ncbi:hypothetical protein ACFPGO_02235 [Arcanobacterium canis]|uniref:Uncharacterized protein n=1 Tax=Arcanobacterium canis TaxID=999183 RepID=A0ABY8FZF3_9ACTO|nr:hypothetical protein [Arcanobacterium canis]WFM82933.1 hypothetical protein P7079_05905 [Arcanobacterium canis]
MRKQSAFMAAAMVSCTLFSLPGAVANARVLPTNGVVSTDSHLVHIAPTQGNWYTLLSQVARLMHGFTPSMVESGTLESHDEATLVFHSTIFEKTSDMPDLAYLYDCSTGNYLRSVTLEQRGGYWYANFGQLSPGSYGVLLKGQRTSALTSFTVTFPTEEPSAPSKSATETAPTPSPETSESTTPWATLAPAQGSVATSPASSEATPVLPEETQCKRHVVSTDPELQKVAHLPQATGATSAVSMTSDGTPVVADRLPVAGTNTGGDHTEPTHENADKTEESTSLTVEHALNESGLPQARIVPTLPIYGPPTRPDSVLESRPGQPIPPRISAPDIPRPQPAILVFDSSDAARRGLDTAATPLLVGAAALVVVTGAGAGVALYRWRP